MSDTHFHSLAKDAGNKLKAYVLAYASGATGVYFVSLSRPSPNDYSYFEQICLITAFGFYVGTVAMCLYELHVDARRFFNITVQNAKPTHEQSWDLNEHYKRVRVRLIYGSYVTLAIATGASFAFLIARVV